MSMTQTPNSLSTLLEESKRLTTHLTLAEIPAVQRGIDLLESESRKLVARSVRSGRGVVDPRAQSLLANSGIDVDGLADSAAPAALLSAFEMLQPTYDANVESFLSQQHEQSIVNAIEESELSTLDDFDSGMAAHMQQVWDDSQRRLFEELGQYQASSYSSDTRAFASAFMNQSDVPIPDSSTFPGAAAVTFDLESGDGKCVTQPRVERYAQVVRGLNDARVVAASRSVAATPQYDLLKGLEKATADSARELKSRQIGQVWSLLAHYYSNKDATPTRIVSGACTYLEETFAEHVDRIVAQYPHDANVGGVPSIHRKVRGFLDVLFGRLGRVPQFLEVFNSEAIWAHMFVLYRCGHRQELLKYALEMEDIITDSDPGFVAHLKAFLDRASSSSSSSIRSDIPISSSALSSSLEDPYKAALYKVLGRGNVPKKATQEVVQTTEDYLWTNLVLIRDADIIAVATGHPRNTLDALQALMLKFGAAHFDPNGNNPLLYLRVLLLCGLFENAVDYLLQIDRYQIEAVHMAIMLAFAGLLRVTEAEPTGSFSSYLVHDSNAATPRLDFARMLVHYARALPASMTDNAVHYLLLLTLPTLDCVNKDDNGAFRQRVVCEQAVVRLMYERQEYAHYLGDIQSDGTRKRGFLERYLPLLGITSSEQFSQTIIRRLADRSRDEGRLADTVLLYNLGERYNTVLNVLCKQLGELLYLRGSTNGNNGAASSDYSAPIGLGLGLDDVEGVARAVLAHYKQRDHIARVLDNAAVNTCTTLLAIMDFLNSHRRGAYEEALETIEATQLLPLASAKTNGSTSVANGMNNSDVAMATQYSERVRALDDSITRNFSLVLLSTMDTLSRLYAGLKESMFLDAIKQANMQILRKKARTLMVFAGMIQFRMPSDTYAKLNRMDVFMN
ncbi:nuclear pore complex subunit [Coemansia sp. RSA 988]|nr:nuclear pore complex subunit [Coemansia sp. RSA 988]